MNAVPLSSQNTVEFTVFLPFSQHSLNKQPQREAARVYGTRQTCDTLFEQAVAMRVPSGDHTSALTGNNW